MKYRLFAAMALLAAPGVVMSQQNIPFSTLAKGQRGPTGQPQQLVITSAQELQSSGLAQHIDPSLPIAPIDWNTEMVIAVCMGGKPSGGYSITIDSIERTLSTPPPPDPTHPPPLLFPITKVKYSETSPSGPAITIPTSPFHMVRLAKQNAPTRFERTGGLAFQRVDFNKQEDEFLGSYPFSLMVSVEADGSVMVGRSHPLALIAPEYGQATDAELTRVSRGVERARAGSLPDPLDVVIPMHLLARPFSLQVESDRVGLAGSTSGQYGYYGQYDARLRPLIEALEAIAERVQGPALFEGTIETLGGFGLDVSLATSDKTYSIAPQEMARRLAQFNQETVRLRGEVEPGPQGQVILRVTEVVSPERRRISGVCQLQNGRPVIHQGPVGPFATAVQTSGTAAEVLRLGVGRVVDCDAWVFTDSGGTARKARIESVQGRALGFSRLTANPNGGQYRGFVRWNQRVSATSRSGDALRVSGSTGRGWLRATRIEIGTPVSANPLTSTGIVSALPGQ